MHFNFRWFPSLRAVLLCFAQRWKWHDAGQFYDHAWDKSTSACRRFKAEELPVCSWTSVSCEVAVKTKKALSVWTVHSVLSTLKTLLFRHKLSSWWISVANAVLLGFSKYSSLVRWETWSQHGSWPPQGLATKDMSDIPPWRVVAFWPGAWFLGAVACEFLLDVYLGPFS